jgi:hypothetical protein
MRKFVAVAAAALILNVPGVASAQKLPPIPVGNHYVCYPAKGEFKPVKASFVDQFGEIDVVVTGITRLCAPATKRYNGKITEVVNKNLHLVCYSIKPNQTQKLPKVLINDQFASGTLVLEQPNEICLPAGKLPLG